MFSSLKQKAVDFLEPYKQKEPAAYAAAEQAIGGVLIADGLFGIGNPLGGNKRPGIFGTISGMFVGIIFILVPTFMGNISGVNNMTASTTATIVSVSTPISTNGSNGSTSSSCTAVASYTVNGVSYTQQSSGGSSSNCGLTAGQPLVIHYNPAQPGAWSSSSDVKTLKIILQIFFWAGVLALVSSLITFFIRLLSIIFGWKLLRDGRKNAANLPPGTNFQTMVDEIKQNFTSSLFGFGGSANPSNANTPNI